MCLFLYICAILFVYLQTTLRRLVQICAPRFYFPRFFSAAPLVLSLSCPGWSFSMDRIFDASSHAFLHHPTGPSYIKVRNLFWTSFFPRICFSRGAKKVQTQTCYIDGFPNWSIRELPIHSNFWSVSWTDMSNRKINQQMMMIIIMMVVLNDPLEQARI